MKKLLVILLISLQSSVSFAEDDDIDFNVNILNAEDRENINLAVFSRDLYIVPGIYPFKIYINNAFLPEEKIQIFSRDEKSEACITNEIVEKFNLNPQALNSLKWESIDGLECLDTSSLSGMKVRPELSNSTLNIN
ncbi:FimD/PapC N-terminal domain-containing protein, partial [Providencia rustigianii]